MLLPPDSSVVVVLLGLLSVLILWREPLDWLTRAVAFTTIDLAVSSVINGFFGSYFTSDQKIVILVVSFGLIPVVFALSWLVKPDEQLNQRKKDIWEAIKEWVELPSTGFRGQPDPLPLAGKPPKLAVEIEECLSRNYPSFWTDMREFKRTHADLVAMENGKIPEEFWEKIDGRMTLHYHLLLAREDAMRHQLAQMQRQLIQQLKSEILEKHYTRLKC